MKSSGILNAELAHAIASLGHGDGLLVVDAGFPIPSDAWRIDLAVARDLPDLRSVLSLIADEMIVEGITLAEDVQTHNRPLLDWITARWPSVPTDFIPHSEVLSGAPARAKAVVRTGAFDPWGNILLTSGVNVPQWFSREGVVVPDYYQDRMTAQDGTTP